MSIGRRPRVVAVLTLATFTLTSAPSLAFAIASTPYALPNLPSGRTRGVIEAAKRFSVGYSSGGRSGVGW
ncbi:hypothetical protein PLICRDRAFT_58305 [Plicaturopsis crispa FD-325 SS-3]|uniref:Uncharacterized protein n=1 Tax=Plicaturopsis crispa FD-325 SS-3 TaxID=944288 RepID=A0A0C9SWB5_PLICR|nr:hypothetical protein PLICRDRAFT_58305 [Plicaturopsis crispa FD-325 SS-3]